MRNGAQALYLGPVSAASENIAIHLIEALAAQSDSGKIFWDIPDANAAATAWAGRNGFTPQRTLTRMYLGENTWPGDPQKQFALAGPEVG